MSNQSTIPRISCAAERIRQPGLTTTTTTTLENFLQYSPSNQAWECGLKHSRRNESIGSKISNIEFDFQSDIINEGSPFSSCRCSLESDFDGKYRASLKSREFDSGESVRTRGENQSDLAQYQFSKVQSVSVGKVIDETIAAIEATNRELLSRAQAAEKSTRILQVQNSGLQRTLDNLTMQNSNSCSPPLANRGHHSRPSLNFPRNNPIIPQHRNSLGHLGTEPSNSFVSLDANLTIPSTSRDRSPDITQSMQSLHISSSTPSASLDSPLPLLPTSTPSFQQKNSSRNLIEKKGSMNNVKHSSSYISNAESSLPPLDTNHQPLSSHPVRSISSPLPGSVRHHSVVLDGSKITDNNRPKLISLEEARRRAKSTSTPSSKSSNYDTQSDNDPLIEGNSVNFWDEILSLQAEEKEMKFEKKKNRLQDLFTGRRNGS